MLVLTRLPSQVVTIGGDIQITVVSVRGRRVRLAVAAPAAIRVLRGEIDPAAGPMVGRGRARASGSQPALRVTPMTDRRAACCCPA